MKSRNPDESGIVRSVSLVDHDVRSPFRRRRRRPMPVRFIRSASQPEPVEWPPEGTGRASLMSVMRGDGEAGASFLGGVMEELHVAFGGGKGKQIEIEQREAEKMRRDDVRQGGPPLVDLDTGKIRIRRPAK